MLCDADERNIAVSLIAPIAFFIAGGLVPTFIGLVGDSGSFGLGMTVVGIAIFCGGPISRLLRSDTT